MGAQTAAARASPGRRDKKPCLGIDGSGCHGFGVGAWAADLKCKHLVQYARGRSDGAIGADSPTRPNTAPIWAGDRPSSGDIAPLYTELKTADLFPDDHPANVRLGASSTYELLQQLEDSLLALKPANSRDQWWLGQAMTLAAKIGDTRWLLAQQVRQGTPKAFLALLVFWLTLLFASFGLFAPRNFTSAVTLTLCALAVAGAFGMILELERGFGGLIHISPQPMLQAVKTLEAEATANGLTADIEPSAFGAPRGLQ